MIMQIDPPSMEQIIWFILGILTGALAPTYYATERLRGFGRWAFSKLPYDPPPGLTESEAMKAANKEAPVNDEEEEE